MPDGACVIKYRGKRGDVWRVKYRDASGRQVQETLGRASDGWTKRRADQELRARLTAVDKDGLKRIEPTLFASFARTWLDTYPELQGLKRSTVSGYKLIIERHLIPAFGPVRLDQIDTQRVQRYVAEKRASGLAPRTVNRHLNLLRLLFATASADSLARSNPVLAVKRPREPRRRWRILTPPEAVRIERAFAELASEADGEERAWHEQARTIFVVLLGTGLRRGELLGLRWNAVHLADPEGAFLRVAETWVAGDIDTPKSEAGERTIALGGKVASALFEHRARTAFSGDDERVFCSPTKGTPFDIVRYASTFRHALERGGIADYVRPFHDVRHSSITNAAAAGTPPAALMSRAGHTDFKTTQLYIDLAGETFREEADRLERRLWGGPTSTKMQYKDADPRSDAVVSGNANGG